MPPTDESEIYDCVIVGAGPAGLTAAVFLGRFRRSVLVVSAGQGRNYAARGIHGFLGYHEIAPGELLERGRTEALAVGAELLEARVSRIERTGEYFELATDAGTVRGRRILLAYGVRDILPDIPRFDEFYGRSIHHCPDCDGWEERDRKIGVIGKGKKVAGLALELLQWTPQVTIFTDGEDKEMNSDQVSKLHVRGIEVIEDPIEELIGDEGRLQQVRLRSGRCVPIESVFFTLGMERAATLAEDLGCEIEEGKICLRTDMQCRTTVEGVWAAGDLVEGSHLVVKSAADGAIAAIAINKSLLPPSQTV